MRPAAVAITIAAALALAAPAQGETEWLCLPGMAANPCDDGLATTVEQADGSRAVAQPMPAQNPAVDCFYVYPTVSEQLAMNADKARDPEVVAIARWQAARFSQVCDVHVPLYRQLTLASIAYGYFGDRQAGFALAYGDVLEAWRSYLAEHGEGRPFVLIGHSQGTGMLRRLIREEIDPDPQLRTRLVSAVLIGGNVLVAEGQRTGGDFQSIPTCAAPGETGCVIAYSTFNEEPAGDTRFGRPPASDDTGMGHPAGPGYEVACTNPAALAGNEPTPLTSLIRGEPFPLGVIGLGIIVTYRGPQPTADTPWLQPGERYTGQCLESNGANVLMLSSIGDARKLMWFPEPRWGTHLVDVNIALGDLVGAVAAQAQAF